MKEVEKILKISGSSQKEPEEIYSLEETKIGKWVDGKPLYRKVVYISNLPNSNSIDYDIFNDTSIIDNCHINGNSYYVDNNYNIPINTPFDASSLCFSFITNNKKLRIYCASNRSSQYAYVIVEYTKTTD